MFRRGKDRSIEETKAIVREIAVRHDYIHRVWLFGSRARGDNRPDSDYDFCILTSNKTSILDIELFREELEDALGRGVDFAYENGMSERFRNGVSGDMRLIYEQE